MNSIKGVTSLTAAIKVTSGTGSVFERDLVSVRLRAIHVQALRFKCSFVAQGKFDLPDSIFAQQLNKTCFNVFSLSFRFPQVDVKNMIVQKVTYKSAIFNRCVLLLNTRPALLKS